MREIEKALNDTAKLNDEIFKDLDEAQENNDIIKGNVIEVMGYFAKKYMHVQINFYSPSCHSRHVWCIFLYFLICCFALNALSLILKYNF